MPFDCSTLKLNPQQESALPSLADEYLDDERECREYDDELVDELDDEHRLAPSRPRYPPRWAYLRRPGPYLQTCARSPRAAPGQAYPVAGRTP